MTAVTAAICSSVNSPANLACTVRFELPRGSYATVLLRALGQ